MNPNGLPPQNYGGYSTSQFDQYYGDPNQFQQQPQQPMYPQLPQQQAHDSYASAAPQFTQHFQAAINNPLLQGYAEGYKQQLYDQYVASTGQTLKYYFAVDTKYVLKKIGLILFPFIHRDWSSAVGQNGEALPAKHNINAPDLYIPLMSFMTYVLVSGFVFGTQQRFSPEKLGLLTTNALFYLILENVAIFVTKYVLNISQSLSIWHALSYSSYKYVAMVFCLTCYLIGGTTFYYVSLAYAVIATVFFLLRSMKIYILDVANSGVNGRTRKMYLLLSITVIQALIIYLLTSSVTSYMHSNYDIAKMALSKMGLKHNEVPLTNDGEVDYEALLKMP
ncbi:Protein YIF1 [Aphelenchoides besseyi]|nr:Protein YIF1 [Aphelenchoides besseyi]KAI6198959.1 Protein YIF1 [Aphelenchoides besseyi]